jgi:hypothetical protein
LKDGRNFDFDHQLLASRDRAIAQDQPELEKTEQ